MAETEKTPKKAAAAGPEPFLRPFKETGSAIAGAVGEVLKPSKTFGRPSDQAYSATGEPIPEGSNEPSVPRVDTAFEAEKAGAKIQVDQRAAALKELSDLNRYGTGAPIATRNAAVTAALGSPTQPTGSKSWSTSRPNVGPQWAADSAAAIDYEARAMSAQLDAKAAGFGIQSNIYQDLVLDQQEQVYPLLLEANKIFDDANRQLVGVQEMVDDVRSNRINPGQFFANIGEAGVFAASMAVAAGHLASAMGGGPNTALGVISGAIERNMRSQALNQAHDRAVLNAEIAIFDRMRGLGVDRLNQANVYNGLLISQAQSALEAAAAATASVEMRAQIGVVQAQLAQKKQEMLMRFAGTVQQTAQMQVFGLADSAKRSAQQKANSDMLAIAEGSQGLPAQDRLNLLQKYQVQTGSAIPPEIVAQIQAQDVDLSREPTTHFSVPAQKDLIRFTDSHTGESSELIPNERFMSLKDDGPESKEKVRQKMEAQYKYAKNWERIAALGSDLQVAYGGDSLKEMITHSNKTGFETKGGTEDPRVTELIVRMNQAVAQNAIALSGRMEAIRGIGEQAILAMRAGLPGSNTAMANILFGDDMFNILQPGAKIAAESARVEIGKYTE